MFDPVDCPMSAILLGLFIISYVMMMNWRGFGVTFSTVIPFIGFIIIIGMIVWWITSFHSVICPSQLIPLFFIMYFNVN